MRGKMYDITKTPGTFDQCILQTTDLGITQYHATRIMIMTLSFQSEILVSFCCKWKLGWYTRELSRPLT